MRPTTDPLIFARPLFQPIRGSLFGLVFYLLRQPFFGTNNGWLLLWVTLVTLGIINPFGPAPGSVEGMVYTVIPPRLQLIGLPEVLLQSLLLSIVLFYWIRHRQQRWLTWTMGAAFVIVLLFPILALTSS
jgi:hypothetical protein